MTKTPTALQVLLLSLTTAAGCASTTKGPRTPKPADLEALKAVGEKVSGTIVWTSARAGLPHIFSMKTDGSDVQQLTRGDFTDWNPRLSPDGTKVLFSRSNEEGFVRESRGSDAWDLYVVGADGRGIGKEVENATWGSWISADEILFQRGASVLRKKLGGEEEALVVDTSELPGLAGAVATQPRLSPSGHLVALTLGGARRQVGVWHLKKKYWSVIGPGEEIEWAADGSSVVWVGPEGKGFGEIDRVAVAHGERVAKAKAEAKSEAKSEGEGESEDAPPPADAPGEGDRLLDLPGARSREFFPRLSSDGKWLVFGAAKGNLEHDLEDFEIYIWEVGTPPETAARMTFDPTSDRWPDIFVGGAPKEAAPAEAKTEEAKEEPKKDEAPAEPHKTEEAAPAEKTEKPDGAPAEETTAPAEEAPAEETAAPAKAKGKAKGKKKKR
jgi:hypothetical protein